jgi:hypothetical protein
VKILGQSAESREEKEAETVQELAECREVESTDDSVVAKGRKGRVLCANWKPILSFDCQMSRSLRQLFVGEISPHHGFTTAMLSIM